MIPCIEPPIQDHLSLPIRPGSSSDESQKIERVRGETVFMCSEMFALLHVVIVSGFGVLDG